MHQRAERFAIAELHELATTLNTSLDQIQTRFQSQQQSTERMRRFVADASHELRSPLSVLSSGLEVLALTQQRGDQARAEQMHASLCHEIERMRRLIEGLLLLARMDRPSSELGTAINLADFDQAAAQALRL